MKFVRTVYQVLPSWLRRAIASTRARLCDVYVVKSYSQEGEDIVLRRIFNDQQRGFYVDVGAHHPRRFSNTYTFYRRGWRGINIEPNPDVIQLFRTDRARDVNLQIGVADRPGKLTYHQFDDPALNSFEASLVAWRLANTPYKLMGKLEVPVERLDNILRRTLPPGQHIDFLSIDVEGLDFAVLQSNDWQRFRPTCVLVEALGNSLEEVMHGELFAFMQKQRYALFAKTVNTLIFRTSEGAAT